MPLPSTFAAASARAEGEFTKISTGPAPIGGPFFYQMQKSVNTGFPGLQGSDIGCAVDALGNVYMSTLSPNSQAVITKFNSSGDPQWEYQTGGGAGIAATSIAIDSLGNVLWAMALNGNVAGSSGDIAVFKLDQNGGDIWQIRLTGSGNAQPQLGNVTTDSSNNVYVCGGLGDTNNSITGFIAKITSTGTLSNTFYAGSSTNGFKKVQVDSNGAVYGIGPSCILWKLNSSLNYYYTSTTSSFHVVGASGTSSMAIDKLNNVWVSYEVTSTPTGYTAVVASKWDGTTVNTSGVPTISLNVSFGNNWDNTSNNYITCDSSNNVYLCGNTHYSSTNGIPMAFISGFSSSGNQLTGFPVGMRPVPSTGNPSSTGYAIYSGVVQASCDTSNNFYCSTWDIFSQTSSTNSKGGTFYTNQFYPTVTKFPTSSITSNVTMGVTYGSSPTVQYYNSSSDTCYSISFTNPYYNINTTDFANASTLSIRGGTLNQYAASSLGTGTLTTNANSGSYPRTNTKTII
jgi:hypothetical protein